MQRLSTTVLEQVAQLPEGMPLSAKALLHLGSRAAVDQVLSRLARKGRLLRASRGLYVRPVEGRFGKRPPSVEKVVEGIAQTTGEVVVPSAAAAANRFGLTTQVPVRSVYLTSGPTRKLELGRQTVEFEHAPSWKLRLPGQAAGDALRALAWAGEHGAQQALATLKRRLPRGELEALRSQAPQLPPWLAKIVSAIEAHA